MPGGLWDRMNGQRRRVPATLTRAALPAAPGVYAWYREGKAVYAGVAAGQHGLKGRLWTHLSTSNDLSGSAFRRNVCELLGVATVATARLRPSAISPAQAAQVTTWIRGCELAWVECATDREAKELEAALLAEWKPPLNRR